MIFSLSLCARARRTHLEQNLHCVRREDRVVKEDWLPVQPPEKHRWRGAGRWLAHEVVGSTELTSQPQLEVCLVLPVLGLGLSVATQRHGHDSRCRVLASHFNSHATVAATEIEHREVCGITCKLECIVQPSARQTVGDILRLLRVWRHRAQGVVLGWVKHGPQQVHHRRADVHPLLRLVSFVLFTLQDRAVLVERPFPRVCCRIVVLSRLQPGLVTSLQSEPVPRSFLRVLLSANDSLPKTIRNSLHQINEKVTGTITRDRLSALNKKSDDQMSGTMTALSLSLSLSLAEARPCQKASWAEWLPASLPPPPSASQRAVSWRRQCAQSRSAAAAAQATAAQATTLSALPPPGAPPPGQGRASSPQARPCSHPHVEFHG